MATAVTMTGLQFDALPYEDGRFLELLDGDLIPVSGPTLEHQEIVFRILMALKQRPLKHRAIVSHDVEFALTSDTMRKLAAYIDNGAQEVWQVYPKTREVVIYAPQGNVGKYRGEETLTSWLLTDFGITVSHLF